MRKKHWRRWLELGGLAAYCCLAVVLFRGPIQTVLTAAENGTQEQLEDSNGGGNTVTVAGQTVEVNSDLAANAYTEDDFSVSGDDIVYISGEAKYGIDVSSHQGEIDWAAVAADGVDFAMIRAAYRGYTEGGLNEDDCFRQNITAALENGIDVGAYLFSQAISVVEAKEEARFVLELLSDYDFTGPVVYDWEPITDREARTDSVTGEDLTAFALAFCQVIGETGYTPMLYFNGSLGYLYYDLSQLQDYAVWYADYGRYPEFAYAFSIWQWTNSGTVEGVSGKVDRNIWFE